MNRIAGKTIEQWLGECPIIRSMIAGEEVFWRNEYQKAFDIGMATCPISLQEVQDAERRWKRFAPYFSRSFGFSILPVGFRGISAKITSCGRL